MYCTYHRIKYKSLKNVTVIITILQKVIINKIFRQKIYELYYLKDAAMYSFLTILVPVLFLFSS